MIDIIATAREAQSIDMSGAVCVVIDVLRATTSMTVALHNGAKEIIAVATIQEAFEIKHELGCDVLLGGERNADIIEGFDLDNSPRKYTRDVVEGKTIVMTTTNGTQAITACQKAKRILIASILNVDNVVDELVRKHYLDNIIIVCAGTEGKFTIEDGLCAGWIASRLQGVKSDFAVALENLYLSCSDDVTNVASQGEHFARLKRKGYEGDIDVCFNNSLHYEALECVSGRIHTI